MPMLKKYGVRYVSVFISLFCCGGMTLVFTEQYSEGVHKDQFSSHHKNVYAIFANDNTKGNTQGFFNAATAQLTADGHTVDILNLYDRVAEIPFFKHKRSYLESYPFYLENKDRFLKSDVLLIVFPVYWYSVPAILKAWIDMIQGWAYSYESGPYAKPLHKVKKVIIVYSCAQVNEMKKIGKYTPVEQQLVETFKFIGIDDISIYGVDSIYDLSADDMVKHLAAIKKLCQL